LIASGAQFCTHRPFRWSPSTRHARAGAPPWPWRRCRSDERYLHQPAELFAAAITAAFGLGKLIVGGGRAELVRTMSSTSSSMARFRAPAPAMMTISSKDAAEDPELEAKALIGRTSLRQPFGSRSPNAQRGIKRAADLGRLERLRDTHTADSHDHPPPPPFVLGCWWGSPAAPAHVWGPPVISLEIGITHSCRESRASPPCIGASDLSRICPPGACITTLALREHVCATLAPLTV
jgi:hypothetical protein